MTLLTRRRLPLGTPLTVLAVFVSLLSCRADLLFFESFSYPNGPLTLVSAGAWATHSGTPEEVPVVSQSAVLDQAKTEDVNAPLPGGPYGNGTNLMLYWSFRLTALGLPGGAGGYFAHLNITSFRSRIFVGTNGAAGGHFRLGLSNGGTSPDVVFPMDIGLNTECVVLVRYNTATGLSTLWVNPAPEGEGGNSTAASDAVSTLSVNRIALRQSTGIGVLRIDDLKVGTAWEDVYAEASPTAPTITLHPEGQTISEGQMVSFRSEAAGTRPVYFQWLKDGVALTGATNTTLTLTAVSTNGAGAYSMTASNAAGMVASDSATLVVKPSTPWNGVLRVLTWNVKGNNATNWSINSPQVQAICRKLSYLAPDVITFNEIPVSLTYEMTNWVAAFLPGYYLASNSGSDGFIRSVIASRHQILASSKHLDGKSLAPFGTGNFTRDLFQARIRVPGYPQPLDVFTTHLKATTSSWQADADKRAAEAKAISNFIAHVYVPTNKGALYVLTGDLNEDVERPDTNRYISGLPIQNLVNPQTGLVLVVPMEPVTGIDYTLSIQANLTVRFDYVLPCAALVTNLVGGLVFRTDVLTNPPVAEVYLTDSRTASDHLPVMLEFKSPYPPLVPLTRTDNVSTLSWESLPGQRFLIKSAPDLAVPYSSWLPVIDEIVADGYRSSLSITSPAPQEFYRIEAQ
jgi:endonuclease/exonuclease/phosphatase family metal-dependent hydrolase